MGGAGQGALRRGARRLLRADEVVVVMVVMVEVVVAVGVSGGVPQHQDISPAGGKRGLGGGQVGAGAPQCGGLPRQRSQDDRVTVQQRGGCSLEDELSALDALILIALRRQTETETDSCVSMMSSGPCNTPAPMSFSTHHVTAELSGGVAAAGPVGVGDGLRCVGLDQTSPVNQTDTNSIKGTVPHGGHHQLCH